jgi:23S rRNA (uracil1939-C5)-methyltransferase
LNGDRLFLRPDKWIDKGYSFTHYNGKPTFLRGGIPGIEAYFTIEKETKHLIFASNYDAKSDCFAFPICGGCSYRHIPYEEEIILKLNELSRSIHYEKEKIKIIQASPINYRNNVQWKIGKKQKIGFFKSFSHDIVDLKEIGCNNLAELIKIPPSILKNSKSIELEFRLNNDSYIDYSKHETILKTNHGSIIIPKNGFMQTNQYLIEPWLNLIYTLLQYNSNVLELYSGSGTIGLYCREKISSLYGFEFSNSAVDTSKINSKNLNVPHFNYFKFDLNSNFPTLELNKCEIWIMNPPRSGLSNPVVNAIKKFKPAQIIYSSCDAMTFARDKKRIIEMNPNYRIKNLYLIDFFPRTPHYEVLAEFIKN